MWEVFIEKFSWNGKKGFTLISSSRIQSIDTKEKLNDILTGISYVPDFVKVLVIYKAR